MDYYIQGIAFEDIDQVVKVHLEAFPGFFLTFLGPRFLKEFYVSFTRGAAGIGFVARASATGEVVGVIVGPLVPDGYFKRLLKQRWWAFSLAAVKAVIKRPAIVGRLSNAVFYRGDSPAGPRRALLSSLAVHPGFRKRGLGRALVDGWTAAVRERGLTGCFLTTDADDNHDVNAFYQSLGWKIESTYTTPQGRRINRYVYDFEEEQ